MATEEGQSSSSAAPALGPTLNLSTPQPFPQLPGEPPVSWERWYPAFETHLLASGISSFPELRRRSILLHCLGLEGQRIFDTLDLVSRSYDNAVAALRSHFGKEGNVMSERYRFRQRLQQEGESIKQFVSAHRQLATNCRFGDLHDQMLRDQIIEKTTSADIREKLLMEPDTLLLSKAVQIACQIETTKREEQQITRATAKPQSMDSIQKVSKGLRSAPKSDSKEEASYFFTGFWAGHFFLL